MMPKWVKILNDKLDRIAEKLGVDFQELSPPWDGYDEMTVSEIIQEAKARQLTDLETDYVIRYEQQNKNRQRVIQAARVNWNS